MSYHWDTLFWWNTSLQNTFCVIHPYAMQHKLWGCTERWSFFLSKNWSIHLVNAPAADYKTLHALKQTQNKASIVCLLFPSYHLDSSAVPVKKRNKSGFSARWRLVLTLCSRRAPDNSCQHRHGQQHPRCRAPPHTPPLLSSSIRPGRPASAGVRSAASQLLGVTRAPITPQAGRHIQWISCWSFARK